MLAREQSDPCGAMPRPRQVTMKEALSAIGRRAKTLSPVRRTAIARKAARARWVKARRRAR